MALTENKVIANCHICGEEKEIRWLIFSWPLKEGGWEFFVRSIDEYPDQIIECWGVMCEECHEITSTTIDVVK